MCNLNVMDYWWFVGRKTPENVVKDWQTFINDLSALEQLRIPSNLELYKAQDVRLLGFCDVSETGYAAVV